MRIPNSKNDRLIHQKPSDKTIHFIIFIAFVCLIFVLLFYYLWIGLLFTSIALVYKIFQLVFPKNEIISILTNALNSKRAKITLIVLLLICSVLILTLQNINNELKSVKLKANNFGGYVLNEDNEPLSTVIIFLTELNRSDTTDKFGKFYFESLDTSYIMVSFIAYKEGYKPYKAHGSMGNINYEFKMKKK